MKDIKVIYILHAIFYRDDLEIENQIMFLYKITSII